MTAEYVGEWDSKRDCSDAHVWLPVPIEAPPQYPAVWYDARLWLHAAFVLFVAT